MVGSSDDEEVIPSHTVTSAPSVHSNSGQAVKLATSATVGLASSANSKVDLFSKRQGTLHFTYITRQDTLQENNVFNCTVTDPQLKTYHSPIQFALNLTKGQGATSKPPRLQYTVSNLTGLVNESVKLECVFSGRNLLEPKIPIVTWYKSDQRTGINNSTKYQLRQDNRSLTIVELTEGDEGYYYCKARINLDNSTSNDTDFAPIFLNVTSAPTFYIGGSPKDQTVGENQRAVFNCNAKGASSERDPDRPVWYINGETLDSIQAKSKFELSIDGKKLTINSVKRSDTLCVQCLVANSVGTTLGSGCLTVDIKAAGPNNVFDGTLIILTLLVTQSILW
ncbi:hypothetical protein Btru_030986 [Bulinus truncatus]|nr:hypothetical protein Btru_030986 [Bulinus truncatus]